MGEHLVHDTSGEQSTRVFVRALLDDIRALEEMVEQDLIEGGIRRVEFGETYVITGTWASRIALIISRIE
jgi:hypothetical protein